MNWLAIINPQAGHPRSTNWQKSIKNRLQSELNAEVVFTRSPGHATELAASSRADGLAVFGGDGTLAEVVNGMHLKRQRLLLLPGGTGNGLARDLGIASIEKAFAAAHNGHTRSIDLIRAEYRSQGQAHSRLIISTASIGYAAEVVVLANRYFKWLGPLCYPLSASIQAMLQPGFSVNLSMDGEFSELKTLTNVMVNNTRHAGNFSAFRDSKLNDGQMEVLIARAGFGSQFLHNLAVLSKSYFYQSAAEVSLRRLSLILPTPGKLMLDGEISEAVNEVRFEVLPEVLKCLV